jgi:hypothetical protein
LTAVVVEYVDCVAPVMFSPFFFHWYAGVVPPLVGVAVAAKVPPEQIVVVVLEIATDGVTEVETVTVMPLLVAFVGLAQFALEVNTQVNTSPLAAVVVEYVDWVAPLMFCPFFFHW